jgi:hypothetical protein
MTDIFLERTFTPAIAPADVYRIAAEGGWCFSMHKVEWQSSFLAAGGALMVCWFKAADAESARLALRTLGADLRRLWIGTVHDAPEPPVPNVLVERSFDLPVAIETIQAAEDASAWCLDAHRVRFARTFFASDRQRMLCLYAAPDAESVRLAQREAGMPVDAIWSFERLGPDQVDTGA